MPEALLACLKIQTSSDNQWPIAAPANISTAKSNWVSDYSKRLSVAGP